jgi:hypothetical protein
VLQATFIAIADLAQGSDTISNISVSLPISDAGTGVDLPQIAAMVMLADLGEGVDVALQFDAAVKIARLVFTIARRTAEFALAQFDLEFSLSQRAVEFVLNQ